MVTLYEVLIQNVAIIFCHVYFVINSASDIIACYIANRFAFSQKIPLYPAEYYRVFLCSELCQLAGNLWVNPFCLAWKLGFCRNQTSKNCIQDYRILRMKLQCATWYACMITETNGQLILGNIGEQWENQLNLTLKYSSYLAGDCSRSESCVLQYKLCAPDLRAVFCSINFANRISQICWFSRKKKIGIKMFDFMCNSKAL